MANVVQNRDSTLTLRGRLEKSSRGTSRNAPPKKQHVSPSTKTPTKFEEPRVWPYNRFFPVHERAAAIGGMAGKGSIGMPAAFQDEEDELKYKRLRRLTAALSSHNDILIELAVCDKLPIWINRAIQEETIKHKQIERWRRDTLNSFAPTKTKSILQQNKEVNKKAARLQAVIRNHSDFVMEPYEQRHLDRLTEGLEILVRGSKKGS